MVKKIVGTFYEKELQKANPIEFRIEKGIKKRGDKLFVLSGEGIAIAGYYRWIDKKDVL